jgi:hypothetical protein
MRRHYRAAGGRARARSKTYMRVTVRRINVFFSALSALASHSLLKGRKRKAVFLLYAIISGRRHP